VRGKKNGRIKDQWKCDMGERIIESKGEERNGRKERTKERKKL
jgi:hypothetical protein